MKLIHTYAERGRLVVFAGAGMSMAPPTSLPSWWDIHKAVAEALGQRIASLVGAERSRELAAHIVSRQRAEKFPPEYQAEIVAARMGESYFEVLQCLDSNEPNAGHRALPALARAGRLQAIVTTNFDRAIEAAFDEAGVAVSVHARTEDFASLAADLSRFGNAGAPCQLLKIHGTADAPATLVDTLAQRKRGWDPAVHACVRHLLRFGHWVFVGYSGADLAAVPNYLHLRGDIDEACGFTWLVRQGSEPLREVQDLKDAYGARAEIAHGELPGWMTTLVSEAGAGVLEARGTSGTSAEVRMDAGQRVVMHVRAWAERQPFHRCALVMTDLLAATNQPDEALGLLESLHDNTTALDRDSTRFAEVLGSLANLHQARGNFDRALDLFEHARSILDRARLPKQVARVLVNASLMLLDQGRAERAVASLTEALALLDGPGDVAARSGALNNLALAKARLDQHDEAVALFEEELELLRALGDEPGRGQALNDLGEVLVRKGLHDRAVACLQESDRIRARLGDEYGRAHTLGNLANLHGIRGEWGDASRLYGEVRTIFSRFGDVLNVATTLANLARVATEEQRLDDAASLCAEAVALCGRNNLEHLAVIGQLAAQLSTVGLQLQEQGHLDRALDRFQESAALYTRRDDMENLAATLTLVGETHWLGKATKPAVTALLDAVDCLDRMQQTVPAIELVLRVGDILTMSGLMDTAAGSYAEAWTRSIDAGARGAVVDHVGEMAASCRPSRPADALRLFHMCLEWNRELANGPGMAVVQFNMAAILLEEFGDAAEAALLLRQAVGIFSRHAHPGLDYARALLARCGVDLV